MIASTQPLASQAGLQILQQGGNAADAAVAVASCLNVTEPCSTGIGGDACALYYNATTRTVECLLGFGQSPLGLSLDAIRARGITGTTLRGDHGLAVTVPGAGQLWEDCLEQWGSLSLSEVLQSAVELCEKGFPVTPVTSKQWSKKSYQLKGPGANCFLNSEGRSPGVGELMKNPDLAKTFRRVSKEGMQKGFYTGPVAESIVSAVEQFGGVLKLDDLSQHKSSKKVEAIQTRYRDHTIWQVPPPSQGVVVLAALNHLEKLMEFNDDEEELQWTDDQVWHARIESLRLAFFEALQLNADPEKVHVPINEMVSKDAAELKRVNHKLGRQASSLRRRMNKESGIVDTKQTDTVYFCVVDSNGNACSFINSNYEGFGTGIVPKDCGFSLQNRGSGFILEEGHPNCVAPCKTPYHTIIPGLCTTSDGSLHCAFGVMGGFMQPQGQLQVISNLIDFGMNPQSALDAPRFCLTDMDSSVGLDSVEESKVSLEKGVDREIAHGLQSRGHQVREEDELCFYGRGQVILRTKTGVLCGGSDPRADGCVLGW
eukprot:g5966.t1